MSVPLDLAAALTRHAPLALAVSGGVDSMTLAHAADRVGVDFEVLHALSPAVPAAATERLSRHAAARGWTLSMIDAGEMADPRYTSNPANRCYFCKENLYTRIGAHTDAVIASGTNVDDLADTRPGLAAAREQGVVHPYVEAGMTKADIYALSALLGLHDVARLPAQPCLSSRIETGIAIDAQTLAFIEQAEALLVAALPHSRDVRCRITAGGVVAEVSPLLDAVQGAVDALTALCTAEGRHFAGVRPYRRGSAFLRPAHE